MFGLFKRGIEHCERDLADLSPKKREKAARNLGNVKDGRAVGLLTGALQDLTPEVRTAAALALGDRGDASAVTSLVRALEDQDDNVRLAAGISLIQLGEWRGFEPMLRRLDDSEDPGEDAFGIMTWGTIKIGANDGMGLLMRTLREHSDEKVRWLAALVLTLAGPDNVPVTKVLAQAQAEDSSNEVRTAAGEALESIMAIKGLGDKGAFCLKCDSNTEISDPQQVLIGTGAPATMGTCPSCEKRVFRLDSN